MIRLVTVAVVLSCFVAVGPASAGTIRIGKAANGKTVRVAVGDLLEVRLPANTGSTGYSWEIAAVNLGLLRPVEIGYESPPQSNPPVVGRPGAYTMTLTARAKGRTALRFEYVAPGRSTRVAQRYGVTVVIS